MHTPPAVVTGPASRQAFVGMAAQPGMNARRDTPTFSATSVTGQDRHDGSCDMFPRFCGLAALGANCDGSSVTS
jgi:hypothetical protein